MNAAETRGWLATRANDLIRRYVHNWDGEGASSVRPDAHRLLMDACNGRPPLLDFGTDHVLIEPTKRGGIRVTLSAEGPRVLVLDFADGTTILYRKHFPTGATARGVICHRSGGEADTAAAVAELTTWLDGA